MQAITHQIQTGQPLKDIEDVVVPHLGEMTSKLHLVLATTAYHNIERGSLYTLARWTLEKSLWEDLINQKLTPDEKLCLLQLAIRESDKIQGNLQGYLASLEKSGKGNVSDIETAVDKPDRALSRAEDLSSRELDGTSAVGRELARRILDRAGKASEKLVEKAISNS